MGDMLAEAGRVMLPRAKRQDAGLATASASAIIEGLLSKRFTAAVTIRWHDGIKKAPNTVASDAAKSNTRKSPGPVQEPSVIDSSTLFDSSGARIALELREHNTRTLKSASEKASLPVLTPAMRMP
jgi:hypothetical protein